MLRRLLIAATAAAMVLVIPLSASGASPWESVDFEVEIHYDGVSPYGPFVASGPAVDAGLICLEGETLDISSIDHTRDDEGVTQFAVIKEFTCDDGSGTFDVRSNIINNQIVGFELVFWSVVDGTGDFENLKGNGTAYGEGTADPDISIEHFTGRFR